MTTISLARIGSRTHINTQVHTNTIKFPLYDELLKRASTRAELPNYIAMSGTINDIDDPNHTSIIYALILHHERKEDGMSFVLTPYKGSTFKVGKGITYQMHNLPPVLIKIINEYLNIISGLAPMIEGVEGIRGGKESKETLERMKEIEQHA